MLAIVDAGPLFAAVDEDDVNHARSLDIFERPELELVIPALVLAEVTYLIDERLGPDIEAAFVRSLADFEVDVPRGDEWLAIADLVERYRDFPLGAADASVAALADRLNTDLIVTTDRRHFSAIRSSRGTPYTLLPE